MKFGKITSLDALSKINFQLPLIPVQTDAVLRATSIPGSRLNAYFGLPMWGNKGWIGKLYPHKTKAAEFLRFYAKAFGGIELNSTHYRVPTPEMVSRWRSMAPEGFRFSPKVPQTISHRYRMMNCEEQVDRFCEAILGFGKTLGCSFAQLPPNFTLDSLPSLSMFIAGWPNDIPLSLEFRHGSWFRDQQLLPQVLDLLEATQTGAVITDVAGRRDVLHANLTSDTLMVRFVGNGLVRTDFTRADEWVERIGILAERGLRNLYFFVHEPDDTFAPEMAVYIIEKLNRRLGLSLHVPKLGEVEGNQMSLF